MLEHECTKEELLEIFSSDLKEIKADVKTLLADNNKKKGIIAVFSIIKTLSVAVISVFSTVVSLIKLGYIK